MPGPATGSTTSVAGIAAVMSFMPFGVSLSTLVLGGACFFGGACARTGLSLYMLPDDPASMVAIAAEAAVNTP